MNNKDMFLAIVFLKLSEKDLSEDLDDGDELASIDISGSDTEENETDEDIYVCIYILIDSSKEQAYSRIYKFLQNNNKTPLCTIISDAENWNLSKKLLPARADSSIYKIELLFKVSPKQLDDPNDVLDILDYCLSDKGIRSNSLKSHAKIRVLKD